MSDPAAATPGRKRWTRGRIVLAVGLGLLALLELGTFFGLLRPTPLSRPRSLLVGVGETVAVAPPPGGSLLLEAVATEGNGERTLLFRVSGDDPTLARLSLRAGKPLLFRDRTIRLEAAFFDTARGEAVQLQWVAADTSAPPILFTLEGDPLPLPGSDPPMLVRIDGTIPPPTGGNLALVVLGSDERTVLARGPLARDGSLAVRGRGAFRWLGTRARFVARLSIR